MQASTTYDLTVKWEDVPSYLESEGPCPANRARQWPMDNNDDVPQSYSIQLELMDANTNQLFVTNTVTVYGTGEHTFEVETPPGYVTNDWWRVSLVAEPLTYDFFDSFEDRIPGNNSTTYTNDAPMILWMWSSYNAKAAWWDQGVGIDR